MIRKDHLAVKILQIQVKSAANKQEIIPNLGTTLFQVSYKKLTNLTLQFLLFSIFVF